MTTQIAEQIQQFIEHVETHLSQSVYSRGAGILRLGSPISEEDRRIRRECKEDDRSLAQSIREMAEMQVKHRPETASRLFKLSELVGEDFVASLKLWKDVRSELEVVAVQGIAIQSVHGGVEKPQLNDRQQEVLDAIRAHGPITEKDIETQLSSVVGTGTIRKHDIPPLKLYYGVQSSGDGYYIPS